MANAKRTDTEHHCPTAIASTRTCIYNECCFFFISAFFCSPCCHRLTQYMVLSRSQSLTFDIFRTTPFLPCFFFLRSVPSQHANILLYVALIDWKVNFVSLKGNATAPTELPTGLTAVSFCDRKAPSF